MRKEISHTCTPMAVTCLCFSPKIRIKITLSYFFLFILSSNTKHASSSSSSSSSFKSIIAFGDSLTDTGNLLHMYQPDPPYFFSVPPYGETFFGRPTGRCSDGRLIIDFIAECLGLPLVPPFHGGENLDGGGSVNFAAASANALPDSFFVGKGIQLPNPNISLGDQLHWFKDLFLPRFYNNSSDRKKFVEESLVMVGEIGGNDYNHAFLHGKTIDLIKTFVPQVVKAITTTINELIKLGAVTLMVPGNFPIGCSAAYLTQFKTSNKNDYDPNTGCIKWLNEFASYHNERLRSELDRIQDENPVARIIYADYYSAAMLFYTSPHKYGFVKGGLAVCCPGCGPYDVGASSSGPDKVCGDPSKYVSWDGLHFTEAAYRSVATSLLQGPYSVPQLHSTCALSGVAGISDH